MAKNENDIFDRKSSKSYTDSMGNRKSDIDSEIDKILAEARQSKNDEKDFFKEEKLSLNYSSDLPKYREEKPKEPQGTKGKRENSHSTREVSHREHSHNTGRTRSHREQPQASKDRKSLSHNRPKKQSEQKSKGKGLIITVAILAVVAGAMVGVYTYLSGNTPFYEQSGNGNGNGEKITTTVPIHETLVVVTVSGTEISYNGEVLASTEDLKTRLNSEESLTLSLINNGADAEIYNAVATVLNSFGGSYELMDEKNTNPSIDTGTSSTIASSPSAEDETEGSSPAQEVADNQQ